MTDETKSLDTGTTTIGVLSDDFVMLAADKRATIGKRIARHDIEKVIALTDNIAVTTSGSVSSIQLVEKVARARLRLKDLQSRRGTKVSEAANLVTNINFRNARAARPEIARFLLGGYDESGPQLYDIFIDGSLSKVPRDNGYYASGSGSQLAMGLLEDSWEPGMSEDSAKELIERAMSSAVQRDAGSGSGILITKIDEDGYKVVSDDSVRPTVQE